MTIRSFMAVVAVWVSLVFVGYMVETWSQRMGVAAVAVVLTTASAAKAYHAANLHVGEWGREEKRKIAGNLLAMAMASFMWCVGSAVMLYLN